MGGAPESLHKADAWDLFWSEYMVWSLRLVCYAANEFFFLSVRLSLPNLSPLAISFLLLAYSVGCLHLIEKLFAGRYRPDYAHLSLTPDEREYRVSRERLIYSALIFSLANSLLGAAAATAFATSVEATPIIYGAVGVVVTIVALFIGIICLVARNATTGRRVPALYPVGLIASLVPVLFIVFTVSELYFPEQPPGW